MIRHGSHVPLRTFEARQKTRTRLLAGQRWRLQEMRARADRPTLVLLHGTAGAAPIWWQVMGRLQGRARILSIGYPPDVNAARLADRVSVLIGRRRAVVCGSSLGGYIAQFLLARHRNAVGHAVLSSTFADTATLGAVRGSGVAKLPGWAIRAGQGKGMQAWPAKDERYRRLVRLLGTMNRRLVAPNTLRARVVSWAAGPAVPRLDVPAHRITVQDSADDPLVPPAARQEIRRRYAASRQVVLPEGGHFPYIVRPDAFARALLEVLR